LASNKKIGLDEGTWKKGIVAYQVAKQLIDEDRCYEDELIKAILKTTKPDRTLANTDYGEYLKQLSQYEVAQKTIRVACERLREGNKDDPTVILAYAGWEKIYDPVTKREIGKRKYYFNGKTYEELEQKLNQLLATAYGMIRRHDRNIDIIKLTWSQRSIKLLEALKEFEELREKLTPIVTQEVELKAKEIVLENGLPRSGQYQTVPDDEARCICDICGKSIPKHKETRHKLDHEKDAAKSEIEKEQQDALRQIQEAEKRIFSNLEEKQNE